MKKFIVLASALLLTDCAAVAPGVTPGPILNPTAPVIPSSTVNQIIAGTIKACAYQPDASAIIALVSTFIPGAAPVTSMASQIIGAICAQITAHGGYYGEAVSPPIVNGVVITGHFVQASRGGRYHRR